MDEGMSTSEAASLPAKPEGSTMAAPTRTPRTSWINEGLRALGVGGPDSVRIEALAQALGVGKGGFYWHFDARRGLLAEMLDAWERVVIDVAVHSPESDGGDPSPNSATAD